jgi:hypothetical protein
MKFIYIIIFSLKNNYFKIAENIIYSEFNKINKYVFNIHNLDKKIFQYFHTIFKAILPIFKIKLFL